jgi:hypothetical protein
LVAGLAVLLAAGCTMTFQPPIQFRRITEIKPAPPPPDGVPPGTPAGPVSPYAAARQPLPPGPPNEQVSLMLQRLAALEDDRKALAARLQAAEVQSRDKDQTVHQASYEIQESTKQLRKTREEMQRWKQEVDDLRTKVRGMEKENRSTLEGILKALEQTSDREALRSSERENRARLDGVLRALEQASDREALKPGR